MELCAEMITRHEDMDTSDEQNSDEEDTGKEDNEHGSNDDSNEDDYKNTSVTGIVVMIMLKS